MILIASSKSRFSSILNRVSVSHVISAWSNCGRMNDLYRVSEAFLLILYL